MPPQAEGWITNKSTFTTRLALAIQASNPILTQYRSTTQMAEATDDRLRLLIAR